MKNLKSKNFKIGPLAIFILASVISLLLMTFALNKTYKNSKTVTEIKGATPILERGQIWEYKYLRCNGKDPFIDEEKEGCYVRYLVLDIQGDYIQFINTKYMGSKKYPISDKEWLEKFYNSSTKELFLFGSKLIEN